MLAARHVGAECVAVSGGGVGGRDLDLNPTDRAVQDVVSGPDRRRPGVGHSQRLFECCPLAGLGERMHVQRNRKLLGQPAVPGRVLS